VFPEVSFSGRRAEDRSEDRMGYKFKPNKSVVGTGIS